MILYVLIGQLKNSEMNTNMELVINLPNNLVESIKCASNNWSLSNPVLDQAIKNGIVLPKGHGDLQDLFIL